MSRGSDQGCNLCEGAAPQDKIRATLTQQWGGRSVCWSDANQPSQKLTLTQESRSSHLFGRNHLYVGKQAVGQERRGPIWATGMSESLHPHLQLTPTGDHVQQASGWSQQRGKRAGVSMHLGITILDEGHSRRPSTASLPSVWAELTLGLQEPLAESHVPALLLVPEPDTWGPEPDRRGLQDQPGGQLLSAAETTAVTGHRDSNAWKMVGPGNWEAVSLWRRWLWTVSVLGLRLSQRGDQPPPAP